MMLCFSIVAVVLVYSGEGCLDISEPSVSDPGYDTCPPWFIYNETTSKCQCGNDLGGIVKCNDKEGDQENAIMDCYCMTHDEKLGTVVGSCEYNCEYHKDKNAKYNKDILYRPLPLNTSRLNEEMCGLNREGVLCGRCKKGLHLSAYSFRIKCHNCSTSSLKNWIVYLCVAYIPLTVFFVIVLAFRISATSPKLTAFVVFAQIVSFQAHVRMIILELGAFPNYSWISRVVLTIYGIWNLDFFRTFMPPICLNMSMIQLHALDYAVAVYPLGLVVLTYMLIQLYARGCMPLVVLWLPFRKCYTLFQRKVDASTTVIDVFATFLVLSYVKLSSVSFDLLVPTHLYNIQGESRGLYVYFDANLEYFGREHLPYGILALFVSFFFLLLPVLILLLYPLRIFQRYFGHWQALRIFMYSFQGSFKDGVSEGRYDCRYFSAVYFIMRITLSITYAFTHTSILQPIIVVLCIILVFVIAIVKPYKKKFSLYGRVDATFMSLMALWNALLTCIIVGSLKAKNSLPFSMALAGFIGMLPVLYIPLLLLLKFLKTNRFFRRRFLCAIPFFRKEVSPHRAELADHNYCQENRALSCSEEVVNYGSFKP